MTTAAQTRSAASSRPTLGRRKRAVPVPPGVEVPPLSPRMQLVRGVLISLLVLSLAMIAHLTVTSGLQHRATQEQEFDQFREELALGTAPIGPTDSDGAALEPGTAVAMIEIPSLDVNEVVFEGTTSGILSKGPGHRRDTVLPGQIGTSVVFGRRAVYGGPFRDVASLRAGDQIIVTTGQGQFTYTVIGVRREGDELPASVAPGGSRLTLTTADGLPFVPAHILRVDADLDGEAVVGPARLVAASALAPNERAMKGDTSTLWVLALWLQGLVLLAIGLVWAWYRWGRPQAWIVFLPPMLFVGLGAAGEIVRLLPNLL